MDQNHVALLKKNIFPFMILGGMTPDLQGPDQGKNRPFKVEGQADQEEHDLPRRVWGFMCQPQVNWTS